MFIWYTFKIFNSFIKSLDEIEIPSEDNILAAFFVFLEFYLDSFY